MRVNRSLQVALNYFLLLVACSLALASAPNPRRSVTFSEQVHLIVFEAHSGSDSIRSRSVLPTLGLGKDIEVSDDEKRRISASIRDILRRKSLKAKPMGHFVLEPGNWLNILEEENETSAPTVQTVAFHSEAPLSPQSSDLNSHPVVSILKRTSRFNNGKTIDRPHYQMAAHYLAGRFAEAYPSMRDIKIEVGESQGAQ